MKKVADILSKKGNKIVSISPETTVLDAIGVMADKNIGSVIVMDNGKYLGIFTERDYSRKILLVGKHSDSTKVADAMTKDLPMVNLESVIDECMELMDEHRVRYLPVFEDEKFIGIISIGDLINATIKIHKDTIKHLENYIHNKRM